MSEHRTLNTYACDHLRRMIYGGELEFDKVYSETKLAGELAISRTPIRDALNRLSQERFIDILPNRGFTLHTPSQADILEAYHVRMMIEGYCAGVVARHYPDAAARAAVERMEDALYRQQHLLVEDESYTLARFWQDDLAFHKAPMEYVNISSLISQYERFMYVFMPHHLIREYDVLQKKSMALERQHSTLVEHAAITEAIKSHDSERIQKAIQAHIESGMKALYISLGDSK